MNRGLAVLLVVSAIGGLAVGLFQLQTGLFKSLQTTRVTGGRIPALGVTSDGRFRLTPVESDGTIPPQAQAWNFYLTDEQLRRLPDSLDGGEVWVDTIETHNSRSARTVKLTLFTPGGITVSIYEGGLGRVVPKQRGGLSHKELKGVIVRALWWCLGGAGLTFGVLFFARAGERKRSLKNDITTSQ